MIDIISKLQSANIITASGKINPQSYKILTKNIELSKLVTTVTQFVVGDLKPTLKQRLYCIRNNLTSSPVCLVGGCSSPAMFHNNGRLAGTYGKYCTPTCASSDSNRTDNIKKTKELRYGNPNYSNRQLARVTHGTNLGIPPKSLEQLEDAKWLETQHVTLQKPLIQIATELRVSSTAIQQRFKQFNIPVMQFSNVSYTEMQLLEWIQQFGLPVQSNTKSVITPYELDIYLPSLSLAIEFNGMYWHSDSVKNNKNYHINKVNACEQKDIRLIQVWECDWINRQDIIKSIIAHAMGQTTATYNARQCVVVELDTKKSQQFFDDNHIQGSCVNKVTLGLEHQGQIISAMSFSKPRFSRQHQWELLRYCSTVGSNVRGAPSKLLKAFVSQYSPVSILTYSNKERSQGSIYQLLGFVKSHTSPPGYFYHYNNIIKNRVQCQKHKLYKMLPNYDPRLTELQNMRNHNYHRIWNSGNDVWVLERPYS